MPKAVNYKRLSASTAIRRTRPSAPLLWLMDRGLCFGRILDYGCGYGADVLHLEANGIDVKGYDPYHYPLTPDGSFDAVLCTYVLNTLPVQAVRPILMDLWGYLKDDGRAFITVRRDTPKSGWGFNKRGTFQRYVELPFRESFSNGQMVIYSASREDLGNAVFKRS